MSSLTGKINAPILGMIARELLALIKSDAALREVQGANAPRACYFTNGTLTTPVVQGIVQAASGTGEIFYQLVIVFDSAAGAGRYRIDGPDPTAAVGHQFPAGGGQLVITGMDNITRFRMIASTATTCPFNYTLFK